jgi:RNA polymerase sigma-70 factor (ECF subfamily)
MNATADTFQANRSRMFGVAYRLLGSRSDAEDILQDAYLNWSQCAQEHVQSATAFLITITKRLCFDRLRKRKQEREHSVEWAAQDQVVEDATPSAEMQLDVAEQVSAAFLAVLERLGPEERVAFLLHDVFDYDYPEVAQVLGKTEAACRQIIHRGRERARDSRARFAVTPESRQRLVAKFVVALRTGDRKHVMALLDEDVEYVGGASARFPAASRSAYRRSTTERSSRADTGRTALYASAAHGDDWTHIGDRARQIGYACPGRPKNDDLGTGGVYEMDNETYQTTKVA